ncbi:hypothetical protein C6495_01750, partial [Candidatus Poribacteria bacterium]
MSAKRTASALMTSLVLHFVIALIAGLYLISQTDYFVDVFDIGFLETEPPKPPIVREPVIREPVRPSVSPQRTVVSEPVQVKPHVTKALDKPTVFRPQQVSEFTNLVVKVAAPMNPNVPSVVVSNTHPRVWTQA